MKHCSLLEILVSLTLSTQELALAGRPQSPVQGWARGWDGELRVGGEGRRRGENGEVANLVGLVAGQA